MTYKQVKYIGEILGYGNEVSTNRMGCAPLLNNFMIVVSKEENLYSDVNRWRYKFNENGLLEKYFVRLYSYDPLKVPENGNYDIYKTAGLDGDYGDNEWVVFEYLTNDSGKLMVDYYSMESICTIIPKVSKNPTSYYLS